MNRTLANHTRDRDGGMCATSNYGLYQERC